jgi:hypothetical protein
MIFVNQYKMKNMYLIFCIKYGTLLLEVGEDLQYMAGCWWGAGGQASAHRRGQLSGMVQLAPIYSPPGK